MPRIKMTINCATLGEKPPIRESRRRREGDLLRHDTDTGTTFCQRAGSGSYWGELHVDRSFGIPRVDLRRMKDSD